LRLPEREFVGKTVPQVSACDPKCTTVDGDEQLDTCGILNEAVDKCIALMNDIAHKRTAFDKVLQNKRIAVLNATIVECNPMLAKYRLKAV